jgi:hypothetical protein
MGRTFRHRGTEVDINPVGLRPAFTASVQQLWKAFLRSSSISAAPALDEMRELLREFLLPVAAAVANGREFNQQWLAPGPWREPAG